MLVNIFMDGPVFDVVASYIFTKYRLLRRDVQ